MKAPTNEVVAVAWIKTLPGIPANRVGTTLPDSAAWADTGFVQIGLVSGQPDIYVPQRQPVLQIDCWAVNPDSQKPPWGKANALADIIVAACQPHRQRASFGRITTPPQFADARVQTGHALSEPRRITPEDGRMADYQFELQLYWAPLAVTP
ncbi:hypothetical protein [Actinomadura miaoliensis]|uniref:DUF3168 domain-containing protein n=1 Tax=Actinomadura miaoliensis TaxID=430685 RepID=A0ABP7W855_9ACTN